MSEFREELLTRPLRKSGFRFGPAAWIGIPLLAILFSVYVPLFVQSLTYLELPLIVTVYFSLMRRSQVLGLFFGAGVGLAQDSLSHQPLGMFGIVKTLVGYFCASVSVRFDVENPVIRFFLAFFFFVFHQFLYWMMLRGLLGKPVDFDVQQTAVLGLLNALVAVPLFRVFDKLKMTA